MSKVNIIFQTKEKIHGWLLKDREWIQYDCTLSVMNTGKQPVSLKMDLASRQPPWWEVDKQKTIKAESLTELYVKVGKFLRRMGTEFK
jgi:hypothetical protein